MARTPNAAARVTVTYQPDQDARELLATWGPAVDRRLEEIARRLQRELGRRYEVDLDSTTNERCSGATQDLRLSPRYSEDGDDHEEVVREALRAAWDHCSRRWDRRVRA